MKKLFAATALSALAGLACAQAPAYPSRPVTLIVPFPPGGSTDTAARIVGERMRAPLGQTVVIENVGGAGGTIGVGRVARAAPGGYTVDIGQWDTHVGGIIYPITDDLQQDFEPVGLMSINPPLMIARKGFPADDLMVVQAAVTLPQARAGAVKILANLSPVRSPVVPGVPTSAESGIPGLYASGWFGLFAPRGTPKEVVAKLNAAMVQALAEPVVKTRFSDLGLDIAPREQQAPEGLAAFHRAEIEKWWPIIKAANIKVE